MKLKRISKKFMYNFFEKKNFEISKNFINLNKERENIFNSVKLIARALTKNKKILFCGNGGSAADSLHLSSELIAYFLNKNRRSVPAISLTSNSSVLTSISNDKNFSSIFSRQIEGLGEAGDILFAISTSGRSKNIIHAIKKAKLMNIKVVFLTSDNVKKKNNLPDVTIRVPSKKVDRIQEMHIAVGHFICELIEKSLK
tara:strand:+ start:7384 stop:7980 length:597 start_codon:yes stop_codon:yes gene_type:complete